MPTAVTNPTWIQVGATALQVGRSRDADIQLSDITISRSHATLSAQPEGPLLIVDHDSRYGTYVNGQQIRRNLAFPGDRVQFGTKIVYRVTDSGLELEQSGEGIALHLTGVELQRDQRTIVSEIRCQIDANQFVGLLAPSGAGKSTLLNCLAGYLPPSSGQLLFDAEQDAYQELPVYTKLLGYVRQEDDVYSKLTLRENLYYAAKLRFNPNKSEAEISQAVNEVLGKVGLTAHADKLAEKLSGGQRKRLSVAMELLYRPRLLLLDEPTSGLDPASEANLMELLRTLSRQGTTIICTTHMLESMLWFDQVIVLGCHTTTEHASGCGMKAYDGPPQQLLTRFDCRNYADLYEKLETGKFEAILDPNKAKITKQIQPSNPSSSLEVTVNQETWLHQWLVQSKRLAFTLYKEKLAAILFLQPLVLGIMVCLTQHRPKADVYVRFFLIVIAIWLGLNNSIKEIVGERRRLYLRDRLAGICPSSYYLSKVLVYLLLGALQILILLVVYWLARWLIFQTDTNLYLGSFFSDLGLFCSLLLAYSGGLAMGLGASAFSKTESAAVGMLPLLIMPQLLISAVASGIAEIPYQQDRGLQPFFALLANENARPTGVGMLVEAASLIVLSRPATLLAESPAIKNISFAWLGDLLHLLLVLGLYWSVSYWLFQRGDRNWFRLRDVK